jgi:hypothetical protein
LFPLLNVCNQSVKAIQRAASTGSLLPRVRIPQSIKQSLGKSKLSLPCRAVPFSNRFLLKTA